MSLAHILGQDCVKQVQSSGRIVLPMVGDTEDAKQPRPQLTVADKMQEDFNHPDPADRPAFLHHLGDVVYYSGQRRCYNAQFYTRRQKPNQRKVHPYAKKS